MSYQPKISDPCHENWDEMTPAHQGKHCAQCCKTVIDFTSWSTEEIAHYLYTRNDQSVCGRFTAAQLDETYFMPDAYIRQVQLSGLSYLKRVAAVILFVLFLSVHAVAQKQLQDRPVVGKPAYPQQTSQSTADPKRGGNWLKIHTRERDTIIMGQIAAPVVKDSTKKTR